MKFMPRIAINDHLMLAGHMLAALESGRVRMHSDDYLEIAGWVSGELDRLATFELERFRLRLPGALQDIAENVLHARSGPTWAADTAGHLAALEACRDLVQRLRTVPKLQLP